MILSLITVSFNNINGLRRTYESLKHELNRFEWIVVDGASKDNTVEFVHSEILPENKNVVFVSEPDSGIYDAMNKGIKLASGEYLLFLNAGDTLDCSIPDILSLQDSFTDINVFGIRKIDKFNKVVKWSGITNDPGNLKSVPLPHQSSVIRSSVFKQLGGYDLKFKLLADHDFFSKAYVLGYKFRFFPERVIATFFLDGVSSRLDKSIVFLKELNTLQVKNFKSALPLSISIRYYYKYILSYLPFSERLMSLSRSLFFNRF